MRVTYTQNDTTLIYQMLYKFYGRKRQSEYLVFAVDKINKQLQLVQNYKILSKNTTKVNDQNRNDVITGFDSTQNFMYTFVFSEQLFDSASQLIEISIIQYVITLNKSSSNGRVYLQQKQIKQYIFKYYYPIEINKPYEFLQFRSALQTITPNPSNPDNRNKIRSSVRKAHGNVIFFKQPFIPLDPNDNVRRMSVQFYMNLTLFAPVGIADYDLIDLKQSKLRQSIFRVLVIINKTRIVLYEIDVNNQQQPTQLSSKLVANTALTGFSYDTTNSPTNLQTLSVSPTLSAKVIPESVTKFPQVELRCYQINSAKSNPASSQAVTALSVPQLTNVISNLLGINEQNITNVNIVKRETLMTFVDTYTIDYIDTTTGLSQPHRLVFEIPRNLTKYRAFLGIVDPIPPPPSPPPVPEPIPPLPPGVLVLKIQDDIPSLPSDAQDTGASIIEASRALPQPQARPPLPKPPQPTNPTQPSAPLSSAPGMNQFGTGLIIPDQILNAPLMLSTGSLPTPSSQPIPLSAIKTSSSKSSTSSSSSTFSSTSTPNNTNVSNSSTSNSSNSSSQSSLILQFPYDMYPTAVKASGAVFTPIITNGGTSQTNAVTQSLKSLRSKMQTMSNFISNTNASRSLPIKFLYSNGYKNFETLPLSTVRYPSDQMVNYIQEVFNSTNSSIIVQSERPTRTQPALSKISSQLLQKQPRQNYIPKSSRINIWSTSPEPNIIQLQFIDQGFTLKTTTVDKDFLARYPSIARVQAIITSQMNTNLFRIGHVDTYLASKKDVIIPQRFATIDNIILLRQKNMSNVEIIQINYEFNDMMVKQILVYLTNYGRPGQIHILFMKAYSNELSRLKKQADDYRVQQINKVRQTLEYIEVQKQILKSFTYDIDSAAFDDFQVKDFGDIVLFYLRYPAQGWLFEGRMGYNRTSKKATVYSVNYAGNLNQSAPAQPPVKPTMTNNATLNAMLSSFGGLGYTPVLIKGCKLKKRNIHGCVICNDDFYLGRDSKCYPRVSNCQIQSGIMCLECKSGFLIDADFNCK